MNGRYILDGHTPVPVDDLMEWAGKIEKQDRRVALTEQDGITVSTVFLGLDHSMNSGPPVLFETMIFGGKEDQYCERYCTWEEAEKGHEEAVKIAFEK